MVCWKRQLEEKVGKSRSLPPSFLTTTSSLPGTVLLPPALLTKYSHDHGYYISTVLLVRSSLLKYTFPVGSFSRKIRVRCHLIAFTVLHTTVGIIAFKLVSLFAAICIFSDLVLLLRSLLITAVNDCAVRMSYPPFKLELLTPSMILWWLSTALSCSSSSAVSSFITC